MQNILKQLRKEKGYTAQDVAEALQIPKSTYTQYENGTRGMKPEIMFKIADFFDISVHEMFQKRLPKRYISVSTDEKKIVTIYRNLTPERQKAIRVIMQSLSQTEEIIMHQNSSEVRLASRTSDAESANSEMYCPPLEEDTIEDVPDNI